MQVWTKQEAGEMNKFDETMNNVCFHLGVSLQKVLIVAFI